MADSLTNGRVVRNRNIAHRQVEGQTIIVKPQSSDVMVLNPSGAIVWNLLDGTRTVDEVSAELAEHFGIPLDMARDDALDLLRGLIETDMAHAVD